MAAVKYTAKREIRSGHVLDTEYELDLILASLELSRAAVRDEHISLGGNQETVYHRASTTWRAATTPVLEGIGTDDLLEFLASVEAGEQFEFDPTGAAGDSPDNMRACKMVSKAFTKRRAVRRGGGGGSDLFGYSFRFREL